MHEERRKFIRFECLLPAEIVKLNEKKPVLDKIRVDDFSQEGLKLVVSFNLEPESEIELKLYLPELETVTPVKGKIIWSKPDEHGIQIGMKILEMDPDAKAEIFDYAYERWKEIKSGRTKNPEDCEED